MQDTRLFLLPHAQQYNFVTEAALKDVDGQEIGSIDAVLVEHDDQGRITDFGVLEIQAVYISGNIRSLFDYYMQRIDSWDSKASPRPDWLSSVKRLVRQLMVKGVILNAWQKPMGVAVQKQFYQEHLPQLQALPETPAEEANVAWFLYDLISNPKTGHYTLKLERTVYMTFDAMLQSFSSTEAGNMEEFRQVLETKLKKKLKSSAQIGNTDDPEPA